MRNKWKWLIPPLILVILAGAFLLYTGSYYHADASALATLDSDAAVTVTPPITAGCWTAPRRPTL